jgi:hypothetical protein
MSDMKMSDVFCCEVDASAFTVISGVVREYADDSVMPHEYTAHAINNHDRMVEEMAELRGKLESIWSIVETEKTCSAGHWDEEFGAGEVFDEIQELAKLNKND